MGRIEGRSPEAGKVGKFEKCMLIIHASAVAIGFPIAKYGFFTRLLLKYTSDDIVV